MDIKPIGRPTKYTQELADQICEQLSGGKSMRTICSNENIPSRETLFRWIRENEEFRDQYTRAKDESADADADKIAEIAEKVLKGEYDAQSARVAIDAYKWTSSKKKPKKYGDRIEQDITADER